MSILQFGGRQVCADGSICSDESSVSNTFGYKLDCFPENGMSFLGNNQDEEDQNDSLYYNWADLDNYEDVDNLNRTHGDGLDWLSLSDPVGATNSDSRSRKRIFGNDDSYKGSSWPSIKCEEPGQNKKLKSENQLPENDSFFFIEDGSKSGQHPAQAHESKPFGYMHSDTPYTCSVYRSSSDLASLNQCLTAIESENVSHSLHHLYELDGEQSMKSSPTQHGIPANTDGSGSREKAQSFKLDDISAGATSFRQLQLAMKPLDLRTKLCIRDSLYRLAWSAEKSQYFDSLNGGFSDDRNSTLAEGINMNMEMETDTNPIDRSIAHLLFHRASDQSVLAG